MIDVDRPRAGPGRARRPLKDEMQAAIVGHLDYAHKHGTDRAEITDWVWPY